MRTLEQQGKSVDDAINKALVELNVSRDQISVEILEEGSRGLFGLMGTRPAKIRVNVAQDASYDTIKEELRAVQPADPQETKPVEKKQEAKPVEKKQKAKPVEKKQEAKPVEKKRETKPVEKKADERRPRRQQAPRGKGRSQQQRNAGDRSKDRTPNGAKKEAAKDLPKDRSKDVPQERSKEVPQGRADDAPQELVKEAPKEQVNESPKVYDEKDIQQITEKAKEALSVILANLQIEYKVEVKRRDDQIFMNIHCDNENFLIGRRGTTLDAVQYLVNRIANKDIEEKIQVVLDTSDYRVNRKQRLEKLALRLSRRVKTTGKSVTVAPMNPHDRRIIHLTLQDDSSIRTLSRGTGFMRRIIISSNRSSKQRKSTPPPSE